MRARTAIVALLVAGAAATAVAPANGEEQPIPLIELEGALTPAAADWVGHALEQADAEGSRLAIIRLDTPGGLDSAVEDIVDRIRTAPLPVVVFIDPGGAGAATVAVGTRAAAGRGGAGPALAGAEHDRV